MILSFFYLLLVLVTIISTFIMYISTLKDSSLDSRRYSTLIDLLNLYGHFYLQSFSLLSTASYSDLHIDDLWLIMKFKIELKHLLQDCEMTYNQYKYIKDSNELFGNIYSICGLNTNSSIQIKFNDFHEFGNSMQNCISIQNFEYFINNTFASNLEHDEIPDVRLSYEDFIIH